MFDIKENLKTLPDKPGVYLHKNNAVLCYSASDFRGESVDRALAGRANKLLHWKDMLQLKEAGCEVYDWGNVSSFEEYNGIDTFKAGFGGAQQVLYNVAVGNSLRGKLAVSVLRILKGGRA